MLFSNFAPVSARNRRCFLALKQDFLSSFAAILAISGMFAPAMQAQVTPAPSVQGTSVSDSGVPNIIVPAQNSSQFFVLNRDLSLLAHSTLYTSYNNACPTPVVFSATSVPRTLATDNQNLFLAAQGATSGTTAVAGLLPYSEAGKNCSTTPAVSFPGGIPAQSLSTHDARHGRFYVVNASSESVPDQIAVYTTSNVETGSGAGTIAQQARTSLDSNAVYTSVVTDSTGDYGLTAITELKTTASPGNLWVYNPGTQVAFKILGPGGVALPAVTSFLIHNPLDSGGNLLVLVNQDGLTASNLASPPQDTTPFTIIDLGALEKTFESLPAANTVTLPFVTQIHATLPYFAMAGAAYNYVDNRIYAVVGGGDSTSSIFENVISYDPYNPTAPSETIVADISSVPLTFGNYPQLALNAASETLQILTSNPQGLYTVGIRGTGNSVAAVTGAPFGDNNFQPTYIAANPLLGETYIASQNSLVDIITRPSAATQQATITLRGSDFTTLASSYSLSVTTLYASADSAFIAAPITITATPQGGGSPITLTTTTVGDTAYPGGSKSITFPAAGIYSLVATAPATASFPAITSLPLIVSVGAGGAHPTTITLNVPASSSSTTFNATVNLSGITYVPTGRIVINDASGSEVARYVIPAGVITLPVVIPVTLPVGNATLTAVYNGDNQNATATSAAASISIGSKVTPALALTMPSAGTAGATLHGNIAFNTSSTTPPTGNIVITALANGSSTPITLATVSAASAFAAAATYGIGFDFTAPPAGTYTVSANYAGDANYAAAPPSSPTLIIGASATITTTLAITTPGTITAGTAFNANVGLTLGSGSTSSPTGNIILTSTPTGGSTTTVATITPTQALAIGGYAAPVTLATSGTYILTATYAGDSSYAASTKSVTITVSPLPTPTITLTVPATASTGATVTGTLVLAFPGTTAPTGSIVLKATSSSGVTTLATYNASVARTSSTITLSFTAPAPGTYALTASYAGDAAFAAAQSNTSTLVVAVATTLHVSVPASAKLYDLPLITVTMTTNPVQTAPPTGNIVTTLTLNGAPTGTPDNIPASYATQPGGDTIAPFPLKLPGAYVVTATYAGDANYGPATASVGITVAKAASVLTLTGPTSAVSGSSINFTAALTGITDSTIITGNITITSSVNGTAGPQAVLSAIQAASSPATFQLNFPSAGTYTITASYSGDTLNTPATSPSLTIPITTPVSGTGSIKLVLDSPVQDPIEVPRGPDSTGRSPATTTLGMTLTALNGFSGPVTLSTSIQSLGSIKVTFTDSAGNPVTDVTPSAAGTHLNLILGYTYITSMKQQRQVARKEAASRQHTVYIASGLMGLLLIGLRRKRLLALKTLNILGAILVIASFGSVLTGCLPVDDVGTVTVTATPGSATPGVAPQSVSFPIRYRTIAEI